MATVVLAGNFDEVVGKNKGKFLVECTKKLSNNGALDIECYDVRPGSIILELQGSPSAVQSAASDVQAAGIDLPGFPPLKAVPTTTPTPTAADGKPIKPATTKPVLRSDQCKKNFATFCKFPGKKGDKLCDDENNIAGCDWDGGDCCGSTKRAKQYKTCTDCKCRDCTYTWKSDKCITKIRGFCGSKGYDNDGFCDANNNNAGCNWDGGDCCGLNKGRYQYCKKDAKRCKCQDCTHVPKTTPPPTCAKKAYKGDGQCDDNNNNAGCDYDGGDCCGPTRGTKYCEKVGGVFCVTCVFQIMRLSKK